MVYSNEALAFARVWGCEESEGVLFRRLSSVSALFIRPLVPNLGHLLHFSWCWMESGAQLVPLVPQFLEGVGLCLDKDLAAFHRAQCHPFVKFVDQVVVDELRVGCCDGASGQNHGVSIYNHLKITSDCVFQVPYVGV